MMEMMNFHFRLHKTMLKTCLIVPRSLVSIIIGSSTTTILENELGNLDY